MLIYAALAGAPSVGIAYDPKVAGFQQSIGQPFINPSDFKVGSFEKLIDEQLENAEEISKNVHEASQILKASAKITAQMATELMR